MLPPLQVPRYKKGQHLRNHDLRVFTQARAELEALHGAALRSEAPALAADGGKKLVTLAKQLVRKRVIMGGGGGGGGGRGRGRGRGRGGGGGGRGAAAGGRGARGGGRGGRGGGDGARRRHPLPLPGIAAEAAAGGGAGFRENPLLAVARRAAAAAADRRRRQQQPEGGAAEAAEEGSTAAGAKELPLLSPARLERAWDSDAALRQAPWVDLAPAATRGEGAALRVRIAGDARGGGDGSPEVTARELADDFGIFGAPPVAPAVFEARRRFLSPTALAWSPACARVDSGGGGGALVRCCLLAVATQSGHVQLWRLTLPAPGAHTDGAGGGAARDGSGGGDGAAPLPIECLGVARAHAGCVTALSWAVVPAATLAAAGGSSSGTGGFFLPSSAGPGDLLVLATAAADGGAKLWLADPAAARAADALSCLGVARAPGEGRAVCIDVCPAPAAVENSNGVGSSGGGWQLLLAVGEAMGAVALWRSAAFAAAGATPSALAAAVAAGQVVALPGAHGVSAVTGVAADPWAPGLVSCCLGGRALSWRLDAAAGKLSPAVAAAAATAEVAAADGGASNAPPRLNPRGRAPAAAPTPLNAERRARAPLLGLAASGSRLAVAAVRALARQRQGGGGEGAASGMTYNRLASGWLQLLLAPSAAVSAPALDGVGGSGGEDGDPLPRGMRGAFAALPLAGAAAARAAAAPDAAALWDVASGVATGGWRRARLGADDEEQVAAAMPPEDAVRTPAVIAQARAARRLRQRLLREAEAAAQQRVLSASTAALEAAAAAAAGGDHAPPLSHDGDEAAWCALRAAAALRRAVLRLWRGPQQLGGAHPSVLALAAEADAAELLLLERHAWRCLEGGALPRLDDGGGSAAPAVFAADAPPEQQRLLSRLLMADWLTLTAQGAAAAAARPLLQAAAAGYAGTGADTARPGRPAPAREANPFGAALPPVRVAGGGVPGAREALVPLALEAGGGGAEPGEADTGGDGSSQGGDGHAPKDAVPALPTPRCAATLRLVAGAAPWRCAVCERCYLEPPPGEAAAAAGAATPACVVCGLRLTADRPVAGALLAPSLLLAPQTRVVARVP